jgi:hypothetical protein
MSFSTMKNVMGVCILYFLIRFIVVLNVDFFFINLVLNYQEKSDTHFIPTFSPYLQRHLILLEALVVMFVVVIVMALPTIVRNAILMQMSNVV